MEALNHVNIGAVDWVERAHLVLSVFEPSLFVHSEIAAERLRDRLAEVGCCLQCKQSKPMAGTSFRRSVRVRPDCIRCRHR